MLRLPAPALHGTFAKAYSLLTRLAARIGWDDLLKCRSGVFVMEEEYRILKAKEEERKTSFSHQSLKTPKDSSTPSVQTTTEESTGDQTEKDVYTESMEETSEETSEKKEEDKKEDEEAEVSEKMENVDLNDESKSTTDLPKMDEPSLERPQQAAEESKVNNNNNNKRESC